MQQEEAAAGRADRAFERHASLDCANASRRGSPTPTCRKTNHTPIT